MAHGATQDAAQDIAPPLVARKDVVSDEERDGPRVIGDDLVAEALLLEVVRVVAQQLAHPGVDRREQVRVVVGRDLLEDAREPLEAHAVSTPGAGSGVSEPSGWRSNSMNTRFQTSSQRGHCSLWSGTQCGPSDRWAPRSKWISLHGPHGPMSAMRHQFFSSPRGKSPQRTSRSAGRPISSRQTSNATSSVVYVVAARRSPGMPRSRVRKSHAQWIASRLK